MSTTTIRLPDNLRARIEKVAAARGSSAHSFMVEAVARAAEQEERRLDFEAEAGRRWKQMLRTGQYHTPEAMRAYGMALAGGDKPTPPAPSKMTPDELKRLRASARRLGDA
ncbi:MAG: CopG family transcriptional regulator [Rubrivivax sp.]|nr:CopG family transcriptional regulator [Rubrivivax sp.]